MNPIPSQAPDHITPHLPPADRAPRPPLEHNRAAHLARQGLWETWGDWRCGPDSPPGVGWKLTKLGQPDRFYRDRQTAWGIWTEKRESWEAEGLKALASFNARR